MFWIVKHKEDAEGAPRLIHWHKEAAEAHAAQFKDGFAEVVAIGELEPLLAANRDLQVHIADLLAQREMLVSALRRLVDKDMTYCFGYVSDGVITVREVEDARAALGKVGS